MHKIIIKLINITENLSEYSLISIESLLIIAIYKYLKLPKHIKLFFHCEENINLLSQAEALKLNEELNIQNKIKIKNFKQKLCKLLLEDFEDTEKFSIVNDLNDPIFVDKSGQYFISGLAAVSRELILNAGIDFEDILGFKKSCLQAPTETSSWTKFCEIEIFSSLKYILNFNFCENSIFEIPLVFGKFENHLKQPIRMHNIYKIVRNSDAESKNFQGNLQEKIGFSEYKYAHGLYFTLADILIYFCFTLSFAKLPNLNEIETNYPKVFKWLKVVEEYQIDLKDIIHEIFEILQVPKIEYKTSTILKTNDRDQDQCKTEFSKLGIAMSDLKLNKKKLDLKYVFPELNKNETLFKMEIKTYKPKRRIFTTQSKIDESLLKLSKLDMKISSENTLMSAECFDWKCEKLKKSHPEFSDLPEKRILKKKDQLKNLVDPIISLAKDNDKIIDFCAGTGHLGLLLAMALPNCKIIFLENKQYSMKMTMERINNLNLKNCYFYQCNIDYFCGKFQIGTSLHACGTATDIVLQKCMDNRANFVCSPCCYGKINSMPHIKYPRSKIFRTVLEEDDYRYIAHSADQTHFDELSNNKDEQGQYSMDIIDWDRKLYAEELGYKVILTRMQPINCTPKNRILVGGFDFSNFLVFDCLNYKSNAFRRKY